MKKTILLSVLLAGVSFAGFEKWTNKDGKTADLELVKVVDKDGEKAGEFKMRNGKTTTLKASQLSETDAEKLNKWEAPAAPVVGKPSAFDELLDGNLVKLDGTALKKFSLTQRPEKYYVFYYTASWCGPCQKFTPSLVEFYNKNKNDKFELVLVSWDQAVGDMKDYAKEKKMPWPQLELGKVKSFSSKFDHGVAGIPAVIVCDLTGKKVEGNFRDLTALEKLVK